MKNTNIFHQKRKRPIDHLSSINPTFGQYSASVGSGPTYSGQMSCSMSAVLFNAYQTLFYLNEITGFVFKMKPTKRSLKFCPFNFSRASIFNIYSILGFGVYGRTRVMRILAVVMLLCHPSIDSIMNTSSRPPALPYCMLHAACCCSLMSRTD